MRRIRSIALVHEILSREAGDDVPFVDIVRPVVSMVETSMISPEHPIRFEVDGDGGDPARGRGHPAGGRPQRAAAERGRSRLSRGARPHRRPGKVRVEIERDRPDARCARHRRRRGPAAGVRPRGGDGSRPVDRAHARDQRAVGGDHRAQRQRRWRPSGHARCICACRSTTKTTTTSPRRGRNRGERARDVLLPRFGGSPASQRVIRRSVPAVAGTGWPPTSGGRSDQAEAALRLRATHWRRMARRSSSEVPPQMPLSWLVVRA